MHTRHRIPTIFNLSMVDVLCCALGCVILMWLLNYREAKRRAAAAGETTKQLTETRNLLAATRRQHDDARTTLALAQTQLISLQGDVKALESRNAQAVAALLAKTQDNDDLAKRLADTGQAMAVLDKELLTKKTQLVTLNSQVEDLSGRLLVSQQLIRQLEKTEAELRVDAKDFRAKLATADTRALVLSGDLDRQKKELSDADSRILALLAAKKETDDKLASADIRSLLLKGDLDRQKKDLSDADSRTLALLAIKKEAEDKLAQTARDLAAARAAVGNLQAGNQALKDEIKAVENRFAGVELTGKRVIFLIDVSGSMKMRDSNTQDPQKWPTVCETVVKVVRSLPELTHYQVILFSDSAKYLFGNEGQWLPYKAGVSDKALLTALQRETPEGWTKMVPAFTEAFRFRDQGLDTIYLFSDGLPDEDTLPLEAKDLKGAERTAYLTTQIRQKLKTVWNRPEGVRVPVRINAIGFFFDNPEVGAFLWALARENEGSFVGMSRP